jgi:adenosine deaminase CECR1
MRRCLSCKKKYPNLIAGYDLVGQEDLGRTLRDLAPELLWFRAQCTAAKVTIPFLFHAGECLGDGDTTDQNLFDAILFKSRRIGHVFSLFKHPTLIDEVKEKQILIESCPISNEVLRLTASILNHPLPALLSRGVATSLSNDDPALLGQGTSGLTHDFWQALQGWENLGLAGLVSLLRS